MLVARLRPRYHSTAITTHSIRLWNDVFTFAIPYYWWLCLFHKCRPIIRVFCLAFGKSQGSISKWGVSLSKVIWYFSSVNTMFFPWLRARLGKISNLLLQFIVQGRLSAVTRYMCWIKVHITAWVLLHNSKGSSYSISI